MSYYGPMLVYDRHYRNLCFVNEDHAKRVIAKLLVLLRAHGFSLAQLLSYEQTDELLRQLISIPRVFNYFRPHFHIENFGPLVFIGNGGFGTVFKAEHRLDGKEYAIKVIRGISYEDLVSSPIWRSWFYTV
ncbi:hypothetical protein AHF37_10365 [Paragonimus kellicotti]|nr:hypothetical protein AHF37_10365 [Paragonimus kellicotti]